MDLANGQDAPSPQDVKDDPVGSVASGFMYSVGAGITLLLVAMGWFFIAKPAFAMIDNVRTAATNASEQVDTSAPLEGF